MKIKHYAYSWETDMIYGYATGSGLKRRLQYISTKHMFFSHDGNVGALLRKAEAKMGYRPEQ